jgi:GNAT superfamily N-acetyltransferase
MGFSSLLDMVVGPRSPFTPLPPPGLPPGAHIREFRSTDREACIEIYRENEPGRFPLGLITQYQQVLDLPGYLKLVCCIEDKPVAVGGIRTIQAVRSHHVWLVYGMVRPEYHRCGIGTTMLLARLAALPRPSNSVRVMLSNVAASEGFLTRFGFARQGQMRFGSSGPAIDVKSAMLNVASWEKCRELLQRIGIEPDTLPAVPNLNIWKADVRELR